jgi:fused signal recognition particle receptor
MFGFLKDKLKKAVSSISSSVEEEIKEEQVEETQEVTEDPKKIIEEEKQTEPLEDPKEEIEEQTEETQEDKKEEKKGFFSMFRRKKEDVAEPEEEIIIDEKKTPVNELIDEKAFDEEIREEIEGTSEEVEDIEEEIEELEAQEETQDQEIQDEIIEATEVDEAPEVISKQQDTLEEPEERKGFFSSIKKRFTHTKLSNEKFEQLFENLELVLMESNVAIEVIEKIKADLKTELTEKDISRKSVEEIIKETLKRSVEELFEEELDLVNKIKEEEKPFIIAFVGINGVGKTTSLAKLAKKLQSLNISTVIAAADTFRVAAIEQIQQHATNLDIKLIKHDYGADPAAVCFDAIEHAKAKKLDVVLIDTAGRNNVNANLMEELKKVIRVAKPNLTIFVGDSLTGNDVVDQAKVFDEAVGIDAIILAKADADDKGGGAISVSYVTHKPIIYLGTGQGYEDLEDFNSKKVLENLGLI